VALAGDTATLRSQLRDLIAILALPAGVERPGRADIPEAVLEVLSSMLRSIWPTSGCRTRPVAAHWRRFACEKIRSRQSLAARCGALGPGNDGARREQASFSRTLPREPLRADPDRARAARAHWRGHCRVSAFELPTPFERFLLQSIITQAEVALRQRGAHDRPSPCSDCEQVARADVEAANRAKDLLNEELERRVVERTTAISAWPTKN